MENLNDFLRKEILQETKAKLDAYLVNYMEKRTPSIDSEKMKEETYKNMIASELELVIKNYFIAQYGENQVFNTEQFKNKFQVKGFLAPFVIVVEKATGKEGSLQFIHYPRFYFNFISQ